MLELLPACTFVALLLLEIYRRFPPGSAPGLVFAS
jgi:hypothetical protein